MVTLIVRNLSPEITRDDLQSLFEPYGVVEGIDLVEGQDFGYVRMRSASDAHQAIRTLKTNVSLVGTMEVTEARPYRYRTGNKANAPQLANE